MATFMYTNSKFAMKTKPIGPRPRTPFVQVPKKRRSSTSYEETRFIDIEGEKNHVGRGKGKLPVWDIPSEGESENLVVESDPEEDPEEDPIELPKEEVKEPLRVEQVDLDLIDSRLDLLEQRIKDVHWEFHFLAKDVRAEFAWINDTIAGLAEHLGAHPPSPPTFDP